MAERLAWRAQAELRAWQVLFRRLLVVCRWLGRRYAGLNPHRPHENTDLDPVILDGIVLPSLPSILRVVGLSAMFGTTMALSVMSDLLALSTFHLYAFYTMATAAFRFHTQAMRSLFHIFRGTPGHFRDRQLLSQTLQGRSTIRSGVGSSQANISSTSSWSVRCSSHWRPFSSQRY